MTSSRLMVHVGSDPVNVWAEAIAVGAEAKSVRCDWREGVGDAQPHLGLTSLA